MKQTILLVGEHPLASTGNSGMLASLLRELDLNSYSPTLFCSLPHLLDLGYLSKNVFPFPIIDATDGKDHWGSNKLIWLLDNNKFDKVVFVGIDIWRYASVLTELKNITDSTKLVSICIAPYDISYLRKDWIKWFNCFTHPCVYSKFAYNLLIREIPKIGYFRPNLYLSEVFAPFPDKNKVKAEIFPDMDISTTVFGFVGHNQFRKDPQKLIKAFSIAKKYSKNDITLFMHTDFESGVFNLKQYVMDCGLKRGDIRATRSGQIFNRESLVKVYNSLDILLNCSFQEGLSWTPIEAGLCGVPAIVSSTTAHIELDCEYNVPCEQEVYQPLIGELGDTWMDSNSCKAEDIAEKMVLFMEASKEERKELSDHALLRSKKWISEVNNINSLLLSAEKKKSLCLVNKEKNDILFVQHSSAGDILMSTQCFKGLRERHKEKGLVYMTQEKYKGILKENPYVSRVVDWNPGLINIFEVVYNPHGEKILPGGWNNLNVKLYSMYPYFCSVTPDKMFIACDVPSDEKLMEEIKDKKYLVVNTGGASEFRRYKHMEMVFKGIDYPLVQIGSSEDPYCKGAIDMREKLTWTESAWVMKNATAAVVIDSFCSHLAGALGTPAVVLYGPAPARVVGPWYEDRTKVIEMEPDMLKVCNIMSYCWSNPKVNAQTGRRLCISPCINSHNPINISNNLKKLMGGLS